MKPLIRPLISQASPVFPPIAFNNDGAYEPILRMDLTRSRITIALRMGVTASAGSILLLARPLSGLDEAMPLGRWLTLVGKVRVVEITEDSRMIVEVLRGTVIDAVYARIIPS